MHAWQRTSLKPITRLTNGCQGLACLRLPTRSRVPLDQVWLPAAFSVTFMVCSGG